MFKNFVATLSAGLILATGAASAANAADISGAGATFPAPLYAKWAEIYKKTTGVGLNYQAIGSGGGIKQIKAKTVDFGASDKPLKLAELNAAGLYQFPTVMGGVVPIVNLPGVKPGQIKLTGALLGDIFLGKIRKWNDPRIAGLNRGVKLPPLPITVVHRSDGSGTSFLFTTYLSMKNPGWAKGVGASDAVSWPTGIGGKGNDGVSAFVKQTMGSIGYVEYAYAKQNKATFVLLQNMAGQFVAPGAANFAAAAAGAQWSKAPGNYVLLLDQAGPKSWPITGATFVLVYKAQADAATGAGVLKFFDWAYKGGDAAAAQLDYVPLPAPVKALVRKQWAATVKAGGRPVYVSK
ncbi:phosphate ABC transporter substrate-binding protein PstS [Rhizorhabdus dicambivorans]|uniref:Phosphate-binding protein PstS n=1 Tax=Rhizorhabdus dicambivorans TaxID=1850238 RepID=A0A2A4FUQ2_9SPHN|nr:phosphate ABC transporter substrate-binding protein PstS [Rhizorhabdus dicambivorans]ATE65536.1 phosphate ABC transporter substrate-binding protein PstS [Rhizorhabdus dicambivorans]PCE41879.1 phosphate ABC transporter substrate-binding protein PstS [Rhizorhabdus dicambivorans]